MKLERLSRNFAFRLIFPLTALVAVVSGIFAYINAHIQESQMIDEMVVGADQLSRSIEGATWNAMLADRREDAYQVMRTIGEKQGIESIRFFNKEGEVTFSTDPSAEPHVDKNAESCFMCHAREKPLVRVDMPNRARLVTDKDGSRTLAMVTPIYNEAACSNADCHAHPPSQNVLGVLDIALDIDHVDEEVMGVKLRSFWMGMIQVVLIAALIFVFTRRSVTRPIRALIAATKAVGGMELDKPVDVNASGELKELENSFNKMRVRLKEALDELNQLTSSLEHKVEERSRQLGAVQQKLIQSDRLASLGQLSASVAHEINNPISGVLNFSMLMGRLITDEGIPPGRVADFKQYLRMISDETARVGRIVSDLLSFSRRSAPKALEEDLNHIIRHTTSLVSHKLEVSNVELSLELPEDLPRVPCDKSQIQQVIINLVMNGAEAIEGPGKITVRTRDIDADSVAIEVEDNGAGIPPELRRKIFDPFVSTKEEGAGVGLGLSVVYGIVEAHGGSIDLSSEVGVGSTFTVILPKRAPRSDPPSAVPRALPPGATG